MSSNPGSTTPDHDSVEAALDSANALLTMEKGAKPVVGKDQPPDPSKPPAVDKQTKNNDKPSAAKTNAGPIVPTQKKSPSHPQATQQQPILPRPQEHPTPEPQKKQPPVGNPAVTTTKKKSPPPAPGATTTVHRPPSQGRISNAVAVAAATPIAPSPFVAKPPPPPVGGAAGGPPRHLQQPVIIPLVPVPHQHQMRQDDDNRAITYDAADSPEKEMQELIRIERQELAAKAAAKRAEATAAAAKANVAQIVQPPLVQPPSTATTTTTTTTTPTTATTTINNNNSPPKNNTNSNPPNTNINPPNANTNTNTNTNNNNNKVVAVPVPVPVMMNFAQAGGPVPPLSNASNIPFLTEGNPNRLQQSAFVHCMPHEIPQELQNLESPKWRDGKFLIKTFLVYNPKNGRRTKCKIQFPGCLVLSANTLYDRLTVINYWLSLKKDQQVNLLRNRDEGLLKYYMQLKDTRENKFRMGYISGSPFVQLKKQRQREKELLELQRPQTRCRDVDEKRTIVVDENSTCLDYVLPTSIICIPCDQFRLRFLPPHHRKDYDKWPLYKDRRKQIVEDKEINQNQQFDCFRLFEDAKVVGRGCGHKRRRVQEFIQEKRIVQKTASLLEWEKKQKIKPCFGMSGESVQALVLQSAEQANRRAVLKDEIIPDSFGLPECYSNRSGFDKAIVRKEERMIKVYSRNRDRTRRAAAASRAAAAATTTAGASPSASSKKDNDDDDDDDNGEDNHDDKENPEDDNKDEAAETEQATAGAAAKPKGTHEGGIYEANAEGLSKFHYVIRSKDCKGEVDSERGHKLCKACTEASVMVRQVARDAAKPLHLTKGATLTKLDVAKLVTSPELIESTIKNLRLIRAKDMKLLRKELSRLRERAGIPKQIRRKPSSANTTNAAVAQQLQNVEQQLHQNQQQHQHHHPVVAGQRRYEVGDHDEVYYDSDEPAEPRTNQLYARTGRVLPRGSASPAKRARTHY